MPVTATFIGGPLDGEVWMLEEAPTMLRLRTAGWRTAVNAVWSDPSCGSVVSYDREAAPIADEVVYRWHVQ